MINRFHQQEANLHTTLGGGIKQLQQTKQIQEFGRVIKESYIRWEEDLLYEFLVFEACSGWSL